MKKSYLLAIVALLAISMFAVKPTIASESVANGSRVDVSQALIEAITKPTVSTTSFAWTKEARHQFAQVVEVDGERMGLIDFAAPDAPPVPQGSTIHVSRAAFEKLGTEKVRVIFKTAPTTQPPATVSPPPPNPAPPLGGDVGINATKRWWGPWQYVSEVDRDYWDESAGGHILGCRNTNPFPMDVHCSLSRKIGASIGINSSLKVADLINIGVQVGFTLEQTITVTTDYMPPRTVFAMVPMKQIESRIWWEARHQWECRSVLGFCTESPRLVDIQMDNGISDLPIVLFGDIEFRPL